MALPLSSCVDPELLTALVASSVGQGNKRPVLLYFTICMLMSLGRRVLMSAADFAKKKNITRKKKEKMG